MSGGGGRLKSRGEGHMKFQAASRGGKALTLASQQGCHVKIVTIKSLKKFLSRLARSVFIKQPHLFSSAGH